MKTLTKITNKEAERLVKEREAKFLSYGYDGKYFLVHKNQIYINNGRNNYKYIKIISEDLK